MSYTESESAAIEYAERMEMGGAGNTYVVTLANALIEREAEIEKKVAIIQNWREQGLSLWAQFAHYRTPEGQDKYSNMALSALEDLEHALESLGLIDKDGVPQWPALSAPVDGVKS